MPARFSHVAMIALLVMLATAFVSVPIAEAGSFNYPYIYKSPRTLAMGGANVAIGGRFDSVFNNPAGLARMPENNWEANLLNLNLSINDNAINFGEDLGDAFDIEDDAEQLTAVNNVLKDYRGKNMHLSASNLSSVANNFGDYSLGIGGLLSAKVDAIPHQGFGSDGLLEVDTYIQTGVIVGVGTKPLSNLHAGVALKFLNREGVNHSFTAREITENDENLDDYIQDELSESGSTVGLDAGVIYVFPRDRDSIFKRSLGLSLMDIGDTDFGAAGKVPMTVNLGMAATGDIPVFESLTVGLDYIDLFNSYEEDDDLGKRVRTGGELLLTDSWIFSAALRAGLYQGYPSYGAELRLTVVRVTYTSYSEEIGAYAGQDRDRRHMFALNIGW